MIALLTGTVAVVRATGVIVDINGIGYFVFTTPETIEALRGTHDPVTLYTHFVVRENVQELYGFRNDDELSVFELLLTVSGIGPKTALSILGLAGVDALRAAVSANDTSYLTRVSGVGRKNADKIVLELKDKLHALDIPSESLAEEAEAVEALTALGYTQKEAREALKLVPKEVAGRNARIKEALSRLGS